MRTIIVGDLHGCDREFSTLLQKLRFDPTADRLILLGDLFDRGPDSYEVFCRVQVLKARMGKRLILLQGNHEMMLFDHHSLRCRLLWQMVGAGATRRSFQKHGASLSKAADWLYKNTVPYYVGDTFQCAHAGAKEEHLSCNDIHTLMMSHTLTRKNQYAGRLLLTGHIHLPCPTWFDGSGGAGQQLACHRWNPLPQTGVICLDTGCAEGNCLTGMLIEDGQYYLESVRHCAAGLR